MAASPNSFDAWFQLDNRQGRSGLVTLVAVGPLKVGLRGEVPFLQIEPTFQQTIGVYHLYNITRLNCGPNTLDDMYFPATLEEASVKCLSRPGVWMYDCQSDVP